MTVENKAILGGLIRVAHRRTLDRMSIEEIIDKHQKSFLKRIDKNMEEYGEQCFNAGREEDVADDSFENLVPLKYFDFKHYKES